MNVHRSFFFSCNNLQIDSQSLFSPYSKMISLSGNSFLQCQTDGSHHMIFHEAQSYSCIKTLIEAVPEIAQKPLLAAEVVNFLAQGTKYEVDTSFSPIFTAKNSNDLLLFYARPYCQNTNYAVICPWPVVEEYPPIQYIPRKQSLYL